MSFLNVKNDTGWHDADTSLHNRGIHDYVRIITFTQEPTSESLDEVRSKLATDPTCPGWTGITVKQVNNVTYKFLTTWDSSD